MKSKRNFKILMFLLVSILFISIGYAAITNINFTINGTAHAKYTDTNMSVRFSNLVSDIETSSSCLLDTGTMSNCATISASVTDDKTATFSISGLKGYGDTAIVRYKIINDGTTNVSLNISATTNTNTEYFDVTTNLSNNSSTEVVNANGTTILTVKAKVKKVITNNANQTSTVTVTISPTVV